MFSVTIRDKGGQVYTFHFDKAEILIGRVKGNDVILPKQNISKRHALVRVQGTTFIIEDLGSTNGTYVNGHRIQTPVQVGMDDKVHLGDFLLQFFDLTEPLHESGEQSTPSTPGDEGEADDALASSRATSFEPASGLEAWADEVESEGDLHPAGAEPPPMPVEADAAAADPLALSLDEHGDDLAAALEAAVAVFDGDDAHLAGDELAFDGADSERTGPAELDLGRDLDESPLANLELAAAAEPPPVAISPPAEPAPAPAPSNQVVEGVYDDQRAALAALYESASLDLAEMLSGHISHLSEREWAALETKIEDYVESRTAQLGESVDVERLTHDLVYELTGLGPLESLLADESVARVEVNAFDKLFVVRAGQRERVSAGFSGHPAFLAAAERLMKATKLSSDKAGWASGSLDDGTSVRIVWPPASPSGPLLTLDKPVSQADDLDALVAAGLVSATLSRAMEEALNSGDNIVVLGGDKVAVKRLMSGLVQAASARERVAVIDPGAPLRWHVSDALHLDIVDAAEAWHVAAEMGVDRVALFEAGLSAAVTCMYEAFDRQSRWFMGCAAPDAQRWFEAMTHSAALRWSGVSDEVIARALTSSMGLIVQCDAEGYFSERHTYEARSDGGRVELKLMKG